MRDQVDARFEHDLGEILDYSPAPVLVSTLLRNADAPPTGVLTTGLPDCEGAIAGLLRPTLISDRVDRSAQVCGESSITWWLRSQAWARRRPDDALAAFNRSLDLDAMPMRAPSQADTIIRRVAARHGATLIDLQAELGPLAPGRWFFDPIHFSNRGAAKVAKLLLPAVRAALADADSWEQGAGTP
ncbi:MAG: SGNH/GDSL hydrolase family protein [Oligoflexia bacterium]|nr:SGNH/GDSL hydrolase family protein [Oligoflexia bacterium]